MSQFTVMPPFRQEPSVMDAVTQTAQRTHPLRVNGRVVTLPGGIGGPPPPPRNIPTATEIFAGQLAAGKKEKEALRIANKAVKAGEATGKVAADVGKTAAARAAGGAAGKKAAAKLGEAGMAKLAARGGARLIPGVGWALTGLWIADVIDENLLGGSVADALGVETLDPLEAAFSAFGGGGENPIGPVENEQLAGLELGRMAQQEATISDAIDFSQANDARLAQTQAASDIQLQSLLAGHEATIAQMLGPAQARPSLMESARKAGF